MERFRGGLVFRAHGVLYHSTLGSRATKKEKKKVLIQDSHPHRDAKNGEGLTPLDLAVQVCARKSERARAREREGERERASSRESTSETERDSERGRERD